MTAVSASAAIIDVTDPNTGLLWSVMDGPHGTDDADGTFALVGAWTSRSLTTDAWLQNGAFSAAGTGADTATWTFLGLDAGTYDVAVSWSTQSNRATDAPYSVNGATPVDVNQSVLAAGPPELSDGGSIIKFETIATNVTVTGGSLEVQLTDDADNYVIADAVAIHKVPEPATLALLAIGSLGMAAGAARRRR
jgi:hypothetical protein